MGVRQYSRYLNVIAATGNASGYASGMNRVCIGYESGMHRGTHQVIALSVELGEGGFGTRPDVSHLADGALSKCDLHLLSPGAKRYYAWPRHGKLSQGRRSGPLPVRFLRIECPSVICIVYDCMYITYRLYPLFVTRNISHCLSFCLANIVGIVG